MEESSLRRQLGKLKRRATWANPLSSGEAASRALNQQALQVELAYETVREQRYQRLVDMYTAKDCECGVESNIKRVESCRLAITRLQYQLLAYRAPRQPYTSVVPSVGWLYPVVQLQSQQQPALAAIPLETAQPTAASYPVATPSALSRPVLTRYPIVRYQHQHHSGTISSPSSSSSPVSYSKPASFSQSFHCPSEWQEPWLTGKAGESEAVHSV